MHTFISSIIIFLCIYFIIGIILFILHSIGLLKNIPLFTGAAKIDFILYAMPDIFIWPNRMNKIIPIIIISLGDNIIVKNLISNEFVSYRDGSNKNEIIIISSKDYNNGIKDYKSLRYIKKYNINKDIASIELLNNSTIKNNFTVSIVKGPYINNYQVQKLQSIYNNKMQEISTENDDSNILNLSSKKFTIPIIVDNGIESLHLKDIDIIPYKNAIKVSMPIFRSYYYFDIDKFHIYPRYEIYSNNDICIIRNNNDLVETAIDINTNEELYNATLKDISNDSNVNILYKTLNKYVYNTISMNDIIYTYGYRYDGLLRSIDKYNIKANTHEELVISKINKLHLYPVPYIINNGATISSKQEDNNIIYCIENVDYDDNIITSINRIYVYNLSKDEILNYLSN